MCRRDKHTYGEVSKGLATRSNVCNRGLGQGRTVSIVSGTKELYDWILKSSSLIGFPFP